MDAYDEEEILDVNGKAETRVVLRLHPRVAPYKAAVLPLLKKPELAQPSWSLFQTLSALPGVLVDYDETGNIGKRYRRHDEIGTPFCFTIDFETLEDRSVTVRHRDDMSQERLAFDAVPDWLQERIALTVPCRSCLPSRRGSAGHVECGLWIAGGLASAHDDGVTHGKHTGQRQRGADERRRSPHAPRKMRDER